MKVTQRDKKLVLALPALAFAIVYCLAVDRSLNARVRQLRQQTDRARATRTSAEDLMRQESQVAQATRDLTSVEAETQSLRETLIAPAPAVSNPAPEQVAALLPRHRLALIEQAMLAAIPQEVSPSIRRLATQSGGTHAMNRASFWRVKFIGTYSDTVSALDELATAHPHVIPASLSMSDGPSKKTKTWTLVLWM